MSVTNGQLANQTVFNDAFVSRTAAQSVAGGKQFSAYVAMTRADVATSATITAMSSSTSFVKLTGATVTEIQGITAGVNGQILSIYNGSTAVVSFAHENTGASAANRIDLPENRSFYLYPDCTAKLVYESTLSRWVLASAGPVFGNITFQRSFKFTSASDNATGTGVTLTTVTTPLVSLTNASLVSIGGVPAGEAGQSAYFINNTGVSITILDEDGSTTAANRIRTGTAASVTIQDHGTIILLYDSSASRWNMIGGSSGGGGGGEGLTNFISESDGSSLTGWSTYADAAATSPVDGTGGSPASTLASSTDSSLVGTENFLWTKSAANRQGEGFSYAFSIDQGYQSKPITISFMYKIASGTYADGDMSVWIYDVTNATLIQPSAYTILNSSVASIQKCEFQASSNSTSYRLIIHTGSTSASAYTIRFDSFSVAPNTYNSGATTTDWIAYTPTYTGFGTVSTSAMFYRRVGDSVEISGRFTTGTVTGSTAAVSLPTGLTSATTSRMYNGTQIAGFAQRNTNSAVTLYGILASPSATTVQFGSTAAGTAFGTAALTALAANAFLSSGDELSLFAKIPIAGWGTSQVLSSDTDTRIVAARTSGDPAVTSSSGPIIFPSVGFDTHSAYSTSTGAYTTPVAGYWRIGGYINSGNNAATLTLYVGGVANIDLGVTNSTNQVNLYGLTSYLPAGSSLDVRRTGSTIDVASGSYLVFERVSGPAQIAASETVKASYYQSAAFNTPGANAQINYDTKIYDSHGAVTTGAGAWKFTAPISGTYLFTWMNWINNSTYTKFYKNGALIRYAGSHNSVAEGVGKSGAYQIQLLAGDYIDLRTESSVSVTGGSPTAGSTSQIEISRVGNY